MLVASTPAFSRKLAPARTEISLARPGCSSKGWWFDDDPWDGVEQPPKLAKKLGIGDGKTTPAELVRSASGAEQVVVFSACSVALPPQKCCACGESRKGRDETVEGGDLDSSDVVLPVL